MTKLLSVTARILQMKLDELTALSHVRIENYTGVEDTADEVTRRHQEHLQVKQANAAQELAYEVKDALTRLRKGTYGACEECGESIAAKRLEAAPWARYCLACQEKLHG